VPGSTACVHRKTDFRLTAIVPLEVFFRNLAEVACGGYAGVVNQNVDGPKALFDLLDHALYSHAKHEVGRESSDAAIVFLYGFDNRFRIFGALPVIYGDCRSRLRKR
jgi:hypothetical protein